MTQHWLDGFAMYDPDTGKVDGYLWHALFSLDWWLWQVQLKTARLLCRVLGHRLREFPPTVFLLNVACTRCDWYED